jgi:hypothetical protein
MMPTLVTFLQAQGTETTTTAAHSPSSNPDSEGKNRAIFNAVRTALTTSGIEHSYWTYAVADTVNKLNFITQRQPDGQYRLPIIALGAPDLPTTPTHLLHFGQCGYLTGTLATKRKLAPRALPARYLTAPSQHQYQVLLPNNTVRLVRASEFIPIIRDWLAPATVPPANVQKPHASSIKYLQKPGVLAAAALPFSRYHRRTRLRHVIQQLSQRKRLILSPVPPRNEPLLTAPASSPSPLCRQQAPTTNAATLLLTLATALRSTKVDLLDATLSIKESRGRPDAIEWRRVHDAELRRHDTELLTWSYEDLLPTGKPLQFTIECNAKTNMYRGLERRKARCAIRGDRMRPVVDFDEVRTASHMQSKAGDDYCWHWPPLRAPPYSHRKYRVPICRSRQTHGTE